MASQNATIVTPKGRIPLKLEGTKFVLVARYTEAIKKRVEFIAPGGNRCIMQNRLMAVELCHVFARCNSINQILMKAIEFHLGVELDSMNLDSRWNCFFGSIELHATFDRGFWGLIPKLEILQEYLAATKKDRRLYGRNLNQAMKKHDLDLGKGTDQEFHTYTFLVFNPAYDSSIIHYNVEGSSPNASLQMYPFNEPLIEVKSHVHPKFIILSLGKMLHGSHIPIHLREQEHIQPFSNHISIIEALYNLWKDPVDDSKIAAAQHQFNASIPSPPPPVSKTALHDAQEYRPSANARVKDEDKVINRRKLARKAKATAETDASPSEERGRSRGVATGRSASSANGPERPNEERGRSTVVSRSASPANAPEQASDEEKGGSTDVSGSAPPSNAPERDPSPTRRIEKIAITEDIVSYLNEDHHDVDDIHEGVLSTAGISWTTYAFNRDDGPPSPVTQSDMLEVLRILLAPHVGGIVYACGILQSIELEFPAIKNGNNDAPKLDEASDSDGDHQGPWDKLIGQGRVLKRQASSEPDLVDSPLSSSRTNSKFFFVVGDHPLSPSPAGPVLRASMHHTPTTKRARR